MANFRWARALSHVRYGLLLILSGLLLGQTQWTLRTIAGGIDAGDGGLAAEASLRYLQGVAVDSNGNTYISDADDHRVRRIDSAGRITTIAGTGMAGFTGDGGLGGWARINTPYGLTVTSQGHVVFADLGNARVRRVLPNGTIETLIGGGSREQPAAGQYINPREVKLIAPRNVLATPGGSIFVSDFGANRVLELRSDGTLTSLPLATTELNSPAGLTLDANGELLVADSGNSRIRRLRRDGRVDIFVSANPQAPLERPVGLARNLDGTILVADTRGDFLWQLDQGKATMVPPGGRDVAVDRFGNIVTAGSTWLRRLNANGLIEILIGSSYTKFRGDGGPALAARLDKPTGVAVDSKGNIYFSDTGNHRVRSISKDGLIQTVAGNGEPGYRGDGTLASSAMLNNPTSLAVDAFDNLYVADTGNHRIRVLVPGGVIQTLVGTGRTEFTADGVAGGQSNVASPSGLAFDSKGLLHFSERGQHRVRRLEANGRVTTVAGSSIRGNSGDGQGALLANLNEPTSIGLDSQNHLFFVDGGNQSLRAVDSVTGNIRTVAGSLGQPSGLAVTPNGVVYLNEAQRHRTIRIAADGTVSTIAGRTNENGFNSDSGNATAITLNEPSGLALTRDSSLILADRLNDRIRRIEPPAEIQIDNSQTFRVVHGATFLEGAVAPGQWLSLLATAITHPEQAAITLDNFSAPISFVGPTQINFQVPYAVSGRARVTLELRIGGALAHRMSLELAAAAPGLFESNSLVIAMTPDGRLNHESVPARAGDILVLYGTGEGLLREAAGQQVPFLPARVDIGSVPAEVLYLGAAPGFPGLLQINLRVPANIRLRGRVPVTLTVGTFTNPRNQLLVVE